MPRQRDAVLETISCDQRGHRAGLHRVWEATIESLFCVQWAAPGGLQVDADVTCSTGCCAGNELCGAGIKMETS